VVEEASAKGVAANGGQIPSGAEAREILGHWRAAVPRGHLGRGRPFVGRSSIVALVPRGRSKLRSGQALARTGEGAVSTW